MLLSDDPLDVPWPLAQAERGAAEQEQQMLPQEALESLAPGLNFLAPELIFLARELNFLARALNFRGAPRLFLPFLFIGRPIFLFELVQRRQYN